MMHGHLLEIALSLIENILLIQIINYFFDVKLKKVEWLFVALFTLLALHINTMNTPLYLIYPCVFLIVYTCINCYGSIIQKATISFLAFALNVFISYSIISTLEAFEIPAVTLLLHDTLLYVSLTVISKFILLSLFLIFRLAFKNHIKMTADLNWKIIFIEIIVFFAASLYSFYIFVCEIVNAKVAIFLLGFQATSFAITLYFIYKFMKAINEKDLMKFRLQGKLLYNNKSSEENILYNQAYAESLDLYKACTDANKYIDDGYYDKARSILSSIKEPKMIEFGNDTLNFLINSKYDLMKHYHISFQAIIGNPLYKLATEDIVYIIGNLLDSTIMELKNKQNAAVKLEITEVSSGVKISIISKPFVDFDKMQNVLDKVKPTIEKYGGLAGCFIKQDTHVFKIVFFNNGG